MTDMQAAIGSAQMEKLEFFCKRRRENFFEYQKIFSEYSKYFILPQSTPNSDPAWFSYIISIKPDAPFTRNDFVKYLNDNRIETRNIFAGNIIRQPAFINRKFRIAEHLDTTDFIMNNTFFLGTYPGLTKEMIEYIAKVVHEFMGNL